MTSQDYKSQSDSSSRIPGKTRLPILYLIIGVLLLVSVVPMDFFARQVVGINRDRLKTNEMLLQNTITRSVGDEISQKMGNMDAMLSNLISAIEVTSGGDIASNHVNAPELRALMEKFVSSSNDLAYVTLLNNAAKGQAVGRIVPDEFLQRELERAFTAAGDGRDYTGQALSIGTGQGSHTIVLVSKPLFAGGHFNGMIGAAVDLTFLLKSLEEISKGGLMTYVVDRQGRVVASPASSHFATGQNLTKFDIVKSFEESASKARLAATYDFNMSDGQHQTKMVGTYSPVPSLEWAVIAQKPQDEAYKGVHEMQTKARQLEVLALLMSCLVGIAAARRITTPLQILTKSSRAIAKGDFSQRVHLKSSTEIGELAQTFNQMSEELEQLIMDLKKAAEENRELFMGSIQMLAGAVDEKDPYTRGHSDRVTKYSVMIATELGLPPEEVEKIRIAAQLHDVGKIGIEDRILKKPGALTPEEYEVMKSHTVRGASILRPVKLLTEMIPGIELHHESLDGKGYPYGLKGDAIPSSARIIAVADTFDAMTTNRPYQAPFEPDYAVKFIRTLAEKKFDPRVVSAIEALFKRGELRVRRVATVPESQDVIAQIPVNNDAESVVAIVTAGHPS